ncbi:thiamine pyrophosphate-binding protein [Aeromicrobium wangtongii]|uniref:thiamine pyrophosphate-binding protein n=1 Tax=Aeromicrobium wangtongii TaxID=2969247 RepID=UPI0020178E71|nr:thiamine pyrophosphate-binding protein [Aeromicrobium wangtongii]MCL3816961.1 thiamine pyrophosphate-binding protein [Aeromicrobium wangtongii]
MTNGNRTYHVELAELLHRQGVDTIFGLIGDGNLFFVDHFRSLAGSRYVGAVHEASAVMMAAGYAAVMNRVGVATVTHGPGLSNALTPLIECAKSSIPMVLIAGDTAQKDRFSPQKIAQRPLIVATGAGFEQARSPETLESDLYTAFRRAWSEKRPIVLNIPIEHTWAQVEPSASPQPIPLVVPSMPPDPEALDAALGIIMSVKRPIILAGKGALDAREPLVELAATIGAPLATTAQAKDLFVGEPADLGIFGSLSTVAAQQIISESDCIISFGASLNPRTTDDGGLLDGKALVQCDVDVAAIANFCAPNATILGDAALTATALTQWLRAAECEPTRFNGPRTTERLVHPEPAGTAVRSGTVDVQTALRHLDEILPEDRTVVVDVGRFALYALRVMHAPDARSWMWAGAGFAAIGVGMGAAVGTAAARPDRPTVLVAGDGGFMLGGLNEFTTAVRHGLDVICVICNDGSYGAEHIQFTGRDLDPSISLFEWPDLAGMADALGGAGVRVTNQKELSALKAFIDERTGPILIDLRLDPERVTSSE